MAARKSSRVSRKYKTRYRIQNWPEYERTLRSRGDVTIWFSDEAVAAWAPAPTGRRGGQRQHSNLAIVTPVAWHFGSRSLGFSTRIMRTARGRPPRSGG